MDSRLRSWVKSITWRAIGIVILGALAWFFTQSWEQMGLITVSFNAVRVVLYYWHERLWQTIRWGVHVEGIPMKEELT